MPVLKEKELRIIGFLCNWCSYGGADTAGVARATQPTDLRVIRVPCSGRVDPLFVVRALLDGADGVLVSGCHPRDCHYSAGNFYARRRLEVLKHFLPILGIEPGRFEYVWVSASEGARWQQVVTRFTEQIHALGPAPRIEDSEPLLAVAEATLSPLRTLGTGITAELDELKEIIKKRLPGLDCVLGWRQGHDAAHTAACFMHTPEDVDQLLWGPLNVQNLATHLPSLKGKKVGIVVKGCDARSVVELLQEHLISREDVTIFSMPCEGTLDMARVDETLGRYLKVDKVSMEKDRVHVVTDGREHLFPMQDYAQSKCRNCTNPGAAVADVRCGTPAPVTGTPATPPELALLDGLSLAERRSFWRGHMQRCLRCYACRNACPMCVCRDFCVAETRNPRWMSQDDSVREKLFFQTVHALHLAGRCTGCGECQRACPVNIPILALRQQIGRTVGQLFEGYKAGMNINATPPLLGYSVEEKNITEREWK